jgi:hypothetical protein
MNLGEIWIARRLQLQPGESVDIAMRQAPPESPMSFWKTKSLAEMSEEEWESLCDGCGRCCLVKLEDEDTGEIHFTDVACKLFDGGPCRCLDYANRTRNVPDCVQLTPQIIGELSWLPATCAYRLLDEGRDLAWWHPLVSGDPSTVEKAGISMRGRTVSENDVHPMDLINRIKKLRRPASRMLRSRVRD